MSYKLFKIQKVYIIVGHDINIAYEADTAGRYELPGT